MFYVPTIFVFVESASSIDSKLYFGKHTNYAYRYSELKVLLHGFTINYF